MPPRNLYAILIVALASLLCHAKAQRTRDGALVGDAMALIDMFYVDEVPKRDLLEAAMSGLTSKLDPYTQFIPPSAYDSFQDSIQQEFAGIGILIEHPEEGAPVRVITPLVGSPALEAGFAPGDEIIEIDGADVATADMKQVRELLKGPIGSSVRVKVRRTTKSIPAETTTAETTPGENAPADPLAAPAQPEANVSQPEANVAQPQANVAQPEANVDQAPSEGQTNEDSQQADSATEPSSKQVELLVRRENIQLESVTGDHRSDANEWIYTLEENPHIAYIRLTSFGERTTAEMRRVLTKLDNRYEGLILDLRGNSGGLLLSAVDICDMFLESGRIVSTRGRGVLDPSQNDPDAITDSAYDATAGTLVDQNIPVAVLIDGDSASASEIVAACLKDHQRATIVGERSFGKGSVQNVFALESGRSALKLTTARYYRPNGENIHRGKEDTPEQAWGVRPTEGFEVTMDDETRRKALRRWEMATYPSMAESLRNEADLSGPLQEVDPQLWRAIEAIDEPPQAEKPTIPTQPSIPNLPVPAPA